MSFLKSTNVNPTTGKLLVVNLYELNLENDQGFYVLIILIMFPNIFQFQCTLTDFKGCCKKL